MKYILRILAMPFILGILLIKFNYQAVKRSILFIRYGGEFIQYESFNEHITINQIYHELKND